MKMPQVYFVWRQNLVAGIDSHRFVSHNVNVARGVWFPFNADCRHNLSTFFNFLCAFFSSPFHHFFISWLSSLLSSSSSFLYFHFRLHETYSLIFICKTLSFFCRLPCVCAMLAREKTINVSVWAHIFFFSLRCRWTFVPFTFFQLLYRVSGSYFCIWFSRNC